MKKIFNSIVFIIIIFTLSGCFNYKEINDYAIVSGISIDENKEKSVNKYKVGIQIMNAKKDEESDSSLITFYEASGKTIYDALEKIMLDSPKELYLGHNEVVVISEELLKNDPDFIKNLYKSDCYKYDYPEKQGIMDPEYIFSDRRLLIIPVYNLEMLF